MFFKLDLLYSWSGLNRINLLPPWPSLVPSPSSPLPSKKISLPLLHSTPTYFYWWTFSPTHIPYTTNSGPLINFWLSSDAEILLLSTDWAYKIDAKTCKNVHAMCTCSDRASILHTTLSGWVPLIKKWIGFFFLMVGGRKGFFLIYCPLIFFPAIFPFWDLWDFGWAFLPFFWTPEMIKERKGKYTTKVF